jgi:hypothetical protein
MRILKEKLMMKLNELNLPYLPLLHTLAGLVEFQMSLDQVLASFSRVC